MAIERPLAAPAKLGQYELIKELGGSGVGSTWIARAIDDDSDSPRLYSILRVHRHITKKAGLAEAFVEEAREAQSFEHPNALSLVEVGHEDGEVFVVNPHVEGETLAALIAAAGGSGLPLPVVLRIVLDALEALSAAHSLGKPLVHGELTPQQIRVGEGGVTMVTHFAVARALAKLSTLAVKNSDRLSYAAPERVKAMSSPTAPAVPLEPRADLFSVGAILWEALSNQRLFSSKIEAAVIQKVLTAPIASLASLPGIEVPSDVDEAVQKALERDPARRVATASDMIMNIEGAGPDKIATPEKVAEIVEKLAGKAISTRRSDIAAALARRGPKTTVSSAAAPMPAPSAVKEAPKVATPAPPAVKEAPKAATPAPPAVKEAPKAATPARPVVQRKATLLGLASPPPKPLEAPAGEAAKAEESATAEAPKSEASKPAAPAPAAAKPPVPTPRTTLPTLEEDAFSVDVDEGDEAQADKPASVPGKPAAPKPPPLKPAAPKPPAAPKAPTAPGKHRVPTLLFGTTPAPPVAEPAKPATEASAEPAAAESASAEPASASASPESTKAGSLTTKSNVGPSADAAPPSEAKVAAAPKSTPSPQSESIKTGATPTSSPSAEPFSRGRAATALDGLGPGHTLGRYEILTPVARGGMASVWAARLQGTRGFQKIVAIKTMLPDVSDDPDFETMFLDEARVAARIRHPNVAEILDLGEQDDVLYLVMEWVEGENLSTLLKAARAVGGIPLPITLRIASQICAGLHAAHELRDDNGNLVDLVHRDMSPANVLISTSGFVKIVDFGVAKSKGRVHVTRAAGMVKGKTPYLSPEQLGQLPIDRRSDIFSLGALLFVLATGLHPFRGETESKTVENIALKDPVPLRQINSSIPVEFEKLVLKALEKDPSNRFSTAAELQRAIDQVALSLAEPTTEEDVAEFVRKAIGEQLTKKAQELRAAIASVDSLEARASGIDFSKPESVRASEVGREAAVTVRPVAPAPGDGSAEQPGVAVALPAEGEAASTLPLATDLPRSSLGSGVSEESTAQASELDPEPVDAARRRKKIQLIVGAAIAACALIGGIALFGGGGKDTPVRQGAAADAVETNAAVAPPPEPPPANTAPPPDTATVAPPVTADPVATAEPSAAPSAEPEAPTPSAEPSAAPAPKVASTPKVTQTPKTMWKPHSTSTKTGTKTGAGVKTTTKKKYNPTGI